MDAKSYGRLLDAQSSLRFQYTQMGVSLQGSFPSFEATINYDPARPEVASTVVEIPVDTIDTGTQEGDDEVQGKDWFNATQYPIARFESRSVKIVGAGQLELAGLLSIKGKSRPIAVPVTVVEQDGRVTFDGSFTLNRTDFGIGAGMWAQDDAVAHDITISFHLVTTPLAN